MIIIPVFNPNNEIIKLVLKLNKFYKVSTKNIYIVNDHSINKRSKKIFDILKKLGCKISDNKNHKGKGAAIKWGLDIGLNERSEYILFADGDGQHTAKDIINLMNIGKKERKFIIGERDFRTAPLLNKFSNHLSNLLFNYRTKLNIKDSQCGLRFIPNKYFILFKELDGIKFDYELNMLFCLAKSRSEISQVAIETVYFKSKYSSQFRRIKDSLIILKIFLKNIFT